MGFGRAQIINLQTHEKKQRRKENREEKINKGVENGNESRKN